MATQAEIAVLKGTATQVKNESQVGGNTAGRVGGLFEGIVDAIPTDDVIDEKITQAVADIEPIVIEGDVDNAPDQEDLTSVNQGGTDVLKFKNKNYSPALFSGLGRVYLRKNVVTPENLGYAVNLLTAEMVAQPNTIYHIQYDYDLNGETITLQTGCVLYFDGGSIKNGTLIGDNTKIVAPNTKIFSGVQFTGFNQTFDARWFVGKTNKTVLDAPLYDCSAELNDALNSGITKMYFSNDVYYVADTIHVAKSVDLYGDMALTYTFAAWTDEQRQLVLKDQSFKGLFTNMGRTIIEFGGTGELVKSLKIDGVNFITDYYSFSTYDDTIPVVSIKGNAVWGFDFNGSIATMSNSQATHGIGLSVIPYNGGYVANSVIRGCISGFDKCIDTTFASGWMSGFHINACLVGYQGFTGKANSVWAQGLFQSSGSKPNNEDAFIECEERIVVASMVYDINVDGRVKYSVKRSQNEHYENIVTPYDDYSNNVKRGLCKTYSLLDYTTNSVLRRCLERATITSRLYNVDTDEDIAYTLNNVNEFCTLDVNIFKNGTNIVMNNGTAFNADVIDKVALRIVITTNTNELDVNNIRSYFVYLFQASGGASQAFRYLDVKIATTDNKILIDKNDIPLNNNENYVYDIIQHRLALWFSQRYTITIVLHGLTNTSTTAYIGAIGICNFLGNSPDVTNANVYNRLGVNAITPLGNSDNSIFYAPNMSRMTGTHNWKTLYVGTLKFGNININDSCFLRGALVRGDILYSTEFVIYAYKNTSNTDAVFKLWSYMGSDANNNEVELHYEKTTDGNTQSYDLYLVLQGPNTKTFFNITELRQTGGWSYITFKKLYADDHAASGTTPLIGYLGTSGNTTKTNILLASNAYVTGTMWYDKDGKRTYFYAGDALGWIDVADGVKASVKRSGTFAQKPAASDINVGFRYFCTDKQTTEGATNGIPIFHKGSDVWVDALGRVVS